MTNDNGSGASRANSFRMHAQEAEDFASQALDEGVCEGYRKLASGWHNLADETEVPNFLLNQYRMDRDSDATKVYRLRAEALRTIAETTAPDSSRQILVHIAEDYERKAHAREVVSRWDLRPRARNSS
jgi:hypothetical protein